MKKENNKSDVNLRFPPDLPQPERVEDDPDRHLIKMLLSLPPNKRTNFLRVPVGHGGTHI